MKHRISFFVFGGLALTQLFSQAPAIEWQKALGGSGDEVATALQRTTDGGYIMAGRTSPIAGDIYQNRFLVVKLDDFGILQWQNALGGTGNDFATAIQQTGDGGYIMAGSTSSNDGDVSGNHGEFDFWVVKLDASGALEWQKCLGGTGNDLAYAIQQTADGGYIIAGQTGSNDGDVSGNHGVDDVWVVKLNGAGAIQWQYALGGTGYDQAKAIQQTADGGYIMAGSTSSNDGDVSGHHGQADFWVVKLDGSGTLQWQKCLGGTGADQANAIQQTADGGYIVAGITLSNNGNVTGSQGLFDAWMVKLDGFGTLQWQKACGGSSNDFAIHIQQAADGGYIMAGSTSSNDGDVSGHQGLGDYWVVKLDVSGSIQWQKCLGGTDADQANAILQTADGGYIIAGQTGSNTGDVSGNHGGNDAWVVKLAPEDPTTGSHASEAQSGVSLHPNPTHGSFSVTLPERGSSVRVEVKDLAGRLMLEKEFKDFGPIQLELDAPAGVYMLQVYRGAESSMFKLVKN